MGSGDFLNIGISGLLGSQAAISTASHNIANVNTEGYNRQVIDFGTQVPNFYGSNYIGAGVLTEDVSRVFDSLAVLDLRSNLTNFGSLETFIYQADRVDSIVADPTTGLSPAIQNFFDAMQAVADEPASVASRQVLFSQTDLVIERFKLLDNQLNTQRSSINDELAAVTQQVTTLGKAIADINLRIVTAGGGLDGYGQPNDLMDKRDQLINELSKLVKVSTVVQNDGATNVFIGNGQSLVIGNQSNKLIAEQDPADPLNHRIAFVETGTRTVTPVTGDIAGGKLGGLLEYRNEILAPMINRLGLLSLGLSSSINDQHQLGMDINDNLGGLFFSYINTALAEQSRVAANASNLGNAQISMTIDDVSQLGSSDFRLAYDAGSNSYTVTNIKDKTVVDTFVAPPVPGSYTIPGQGITLNFTSGVPSDRDNFMLTPTRHAVNGLGKTITDISQIAAAAPVRGITDISNSGTAEIISTSVQDTSNASFAIDKALNPPIRIEFTDAVTYNVINVIDANTNAVMVGGVQYFPNQENDMLSQAGLNLGYEIKIGGTAVTGDSFSVDYNAGGIGDNRNALAMADVQTKNILFNGKSTLQESYGLMVSEVGTRTNEAKISLEASRSLLRQNEAKIQAVSGVNLDEEAARLIKFQQSYQASAQIINTAQVLFDSLIQAVR